MCFISKCFLEALNLCLGVKTSEHLNKQLQTEEEELTLHSIETENYSTQTSSPPPAHFSSYNTFLSVTWVISGHKLMLYSFQAVSLKFKPLLKCHKNLRTSQVHPTQDLNLENQLASASSWNPPPFHIPADLKFSSLNKHYTQSLFFSFCILACILGVSVLAMNQKQYHFTTRDCTQSTI